MRLRKEPTWTFSTRIPKLGGNLEDKRQPGTGSLQWLELEPGLDLSGAYLII